MATKAQNTKAGAQTAGTPRKSQAKERVRINDAEASRADILAAAQKEFSEKGLSGARVDSIAERTRINKRMIYYYFGSKEGLYRAVLERSYGHIRMSEAAVELDALPPEEALRQHVRITFDYHNMHPDFVRLVMNENIHRAEHLKQIDGLRESNHAVIDLLKALIARGEAEGSFRPGIDPIELHMNMTALAFYNVSNQFTFSHNFEIDMASPEAVARRAKQVADIILAWVTKKG